MVRGEPSRRLMAGSRNVGISRELEYLNYYHTCQTHLSLNNDPPQFGLIFTNSDCDRIVAGYFSCRSQLHYQFARNRTKRLIVSLSPRRLTMARSSGKAPTWWRFRVRDVGIVVRRPSSGQVSVTVSSSDPHPITSARKIESLSVTSPNFSKKI